LLIVGDGPEKQRLETLCHDKGIHHSVVFTGQHEHALPYLRAMAVFLLTSLREQMPMTILEAMAVGVPVIATRVGEIPHMIDDRVNGFVHRLDDPVGLCPAHIVPPIPTNQEGAWEAARQRRLRIAFSGTMVAIQSHDRGDLWQLRR
jgi:hypothetical protein